jgi:uncharacterized protein YndB with AHSA1/START domain
MEHAIDEGTRLAIRRTYNAPVAAVYAAWTDPQQIRTGWARRTPSDRPT